VLAQLTKALLVEHKTQTTTHIQVAVAVLAQWVEVIHLVQHQALVALAFLPAFPVLPLLMVVAVVEVDMVRLLAVALVAQAAVVLAAGVLPP
jgi:hypothetical protein